MKIINHIFPRRISLRSSTIQTRPPPPLLRKKALLIGIQNVRQDTVEITQEERTAEEDVHIAPKRKKKRAQKDTDKEGAPKDPELKGPHRDVFLMKQLLIEVYHYDPEDIVVLIDDDDPDHIQPTKENMIRMMIEFIEGALAGDRFFFHFSGHATQEDTDSLEEEDRKDELIISSDGKTIKDDHLRELLVDPLPIGSTLVAIFDSCHSCSLLDLQHFRCNRVYMPCINKGRRQTDFARNIIMRQNARIDVSVRSVNQAKRLSSNTITWKRTSIDQVLSSSVSSSSGTFDRAHMSPIRTKSKKSLSLSTDLEKWYGSTMSPIERCGSPVSMYCDGQCHNKPFEEGEPRADVISLSSSKDGQRSWENPQGSSMTQALVEVLKKDPHPSLKNLLTLVSHEIHGIYLLMHCQARKYKEQIKDYNDLRQQEGKEVKKPKSVEMNNFQNPQLSSMQPLDMNRRWHL